MKVLREERARSAAVTRLRWTRRSGKVRNALAIAIAASVSANAVYAETYTNGGGTNTWSNASNWNPAEPTSGTTAILPLISTLPGGSSSTITLSTGEQALSLSISDAYTLSGGDLTLGAGGNIAVDTGVSATLSSTLLGTNGLTLNPTVGGTAGTLTLGGTNTFTGTVAVNAGILRFSADNNLGAAANGLNLGTAGAISYFGAGSISSARTIALGTTASTDFTSTIRNETAGTTLTLSGVISGGPGNAAATNTLGNTALNITGNGSVALTGTNTFTGNIVVDTATLVFSADAQLGATASGTYKSVVLQNGGTFLVNTTTTYNPTTGTNTSNKRFVIGTGGGTINVISGGTLQLDDPDQLTGTGNTLTKVGPGTLFLNSQTYVVGQINLNAGSIRAQGVNTLGTAALTAPMNVASGATLDIQGAMTTGRAISITGAGLNGVGAINNSSTTPASLAVPVFLTGDTTFGATANGGSVTLASLDGGSANRTLTKVGAGVLAVSGTGTNFTGTTTVNVTNGVVSAGNATAFGSNALINVTQFSGTTLSGYQQSSAAAAGYTYRFQPNTILSGNTTFFNSLVVGTNINLIPNTIAEAAAGQNATAATAFGFANDASRFFGIGGVVTGETVTVGTGTPWVGISNDGFTGRSFAGTINANSNFIVRATNGNTFVLNQVTLNSSSPVTMSLTSGVVQFSNPASTYGSNVTIAVTNGATVQPTVNTAFGTSTTPANNAAVVIQNGGVINPNAGVTVNNTVTIDPGGILNIDDANNLAGTGSYVQSPGSVVRITNNGATALGGAMSPGTVAGSIVRLQTDSIGSLATKIHPGAIFEVNGGTRLLPTGTSLAPSMSLNSSGNVTIGALNNIPTGVITNDGSSRILNNASATTASVITVGSGGATFVATDNTTLTISGSGANPSAGSLAIEAGTATINIGVATPTIIDGFSKGAANGVVAIGGPTDNTTTPTVGFRAGAVNVLSGTFTHNGGGIPFQLNGNGTFNSGTGIGLLTVNNGAFFVNLTGLLIDAQLNLQTGAIARFQAGGTDNTVQPQLISGLQGSGNIFLGNNTTGTNRDVSLTVGANGVSSTFSGVIADADSTRNGSLTKVGAGTLTLTGANTYTLGTTISAGTLQLGNGGNSGSVAGNIVNNAALVINRSDVFSLPGVISGSGTLTKNGSGTATLSAAPTYTGATTINGGGLTIAAGTSFPTSALAVNAGGRFSYNPAASGTLSLGAAPVTLADGSQIGFSFGSTISTTGAITAAAGGTIGLAATGTPAATTILTGGSGSNLDQANYILLNPTNYTYSITSTPTSVSITPTVVTALTNAFWKGGFTVNSWAASDGSTQSNWTTDSAGANPTPLTPGSTTTVNYSATGATGQTTHTLGANISVAGVVNSGSSPVNLVNDGNVLTIGAGGITVNSSASAMTLAPTVVIGANQSWTNNSTTNALTVGSSGTGVNLGSATLTVAGAGSTTIAGNVSATTGTLTVSAGGAVNISGNITATGAAPINHSGAGALTISGNINAPSSNLTKSGAGTLTLAGSDNFLQQINLNSASVLDIGAGNLTLNDAGGNTIQSSITSGTATINATGGGSIILTRPGSDGPDNGVANGGTLVINARITGPGSFEFFRSAVTTGVIVLANPNNSFADSVITNTGIISAASFGNSGTPSPLGLNPTIQLGGGANAGTLRYTGTGETTNKVIALSSTTANPTIDMAGTGSLIFSSNFNTSGAGSKTLNLTGSTSGVGVINGVIANNSITNITSLTKSGTGTWILGGDNTYTGTTTVTAGTLLINGSVAGNATVSGGTIGGNGSIGGTLSISSGATLAPGNSPGVLTVSGAVSLAAGSTYQVQIGGTTPGNGANNYDQTNAGSLTLTGSTLSVSSVNDFSSNDSNVIYYIMSQSGPNAVTGTFAGLPEGTAFTFPDGVSTARITYTANWTGNLATSTGQGTGNDVALYNVNLVPEPATAGLLGMAAVGLLSRRRRLRTAR